MFGKKSKAKDPLTDFMEGLKSELDDLVKAYVKEYPSTKLSHTFPCVTSLMGATSMVGIIRRMIKK